ncbi:MAG TPA: hypothetical protein VJL89_05600 [Thermodesulfovibrionia bacterium]|nr:hypothetical protein [Thermodesulfovibrionia bacterium]
MQRADIQWFILFIVLTSVAGCVTVPTQPSEEQPSDIRNSIQVMEDGVREVVIYAPFDNVFRNAENILLAGREQIAGVAATYIEGKITTRFKGIDKDTLETFAFTNGMIKKGWKKGGYAYAIHFLAIAKHQTKMRVKAVIYATFSDAPLTEEQLNLWQLMTSKGVLEETFLVELNKAAQEGYETTWP